MNKLWTTPTIPIGLVGIARPQSASSCTQLGDVTHRSVLHRLRNELQMSCNELRLRRVGGAAQELRIPGIWSCDERSCKGAAFPAFRRQNWTSGAAKARKWAAKSHKTTYFLYLYLYFPSYCNIIFKKCQAFLRKKFLESKNVDNFKSRGRRRGILSSFCSVFVAKLHDFAAKLTVIVRNWAQNSPIDVVGTAFCYEMRGQRSCISPYYII